MPLPPLLSPLLRAALYPLLLLLLSSLLLVVILVLLLRRTLASRRPLQRTRLFSLLAHVPSPRTRVVGLFHPYCNAGGGGERVLWTALAAMQRTEPDALFVVYTGDAATGDATSDKAHGRMTKDAILERVSSRFGLSLAPSTLHFVPLRRRFLVEDRTWPRFTLVGQSLGSVLLAYEGLAGREGVVPDVWIDTMGYAFAYPLIRTLLPGIPVGSYTHYPTISTDMLRRVRLRQAGHTNPSRVARSWVLSTLKLGYYTLFAHAYALSLRRAHVVMVNSTWTARHVEALLSPSPSSSSSSSTSSLPDSDSGPDAPSAAESTAPRPGPNKLRKRRPLPSQRIPSSTPASLPSPSPPSSSAPRTTKVRIVYPPCSTAALASLPLSTTARLASSSSSAGRAVILSLAQFRPEKEHPTQLRALAALLERWPEWSGRVGLVCAGSCRGDEDERRVRALRGLAADLGLRERRGEEGGEEGEEEWDVAFVVNAPWSTLVELMRTASVGLHTMIDEHFGITVVEFQAAGLIPLAHASAGPLLDIVVPYPPSSSSSSSPSPSSAGVEPSATGFLAPSPSSLSFSSASPADLPAAFAEQLHHILSLPPSAQDAIRERARKNAVERFSEEVFERGWGEGWAELVGVLEGRG
ncbi:hypothetical protein JCM10207_005057 [Rhodosporidiobolus poonsookiae]